MGLLMFREPNPEDAKKKRKCNWTECARSPIRRTNRSAAANRRGEHQLRLAGDPYLDPTSRSSHDERSTSRDDLEAARTRRLRELVQWVAQHDDDDDRNRRAAGDLHGMLWSDNTGTSSNRGSTVRNPEVNGRIAREGLRALARNPMAFTGFERRGHDLYFGFDQSMPLDILLEGSELAEYNGEISSSPSSVDSTSPVRLNNPSTEVNDAETTTISISQGRLHVSGTRSSRPPQDSIAPLLTLHNTSGLGDRRRSPSPEEEDWGNLNSTIRPDAQLPSATSSFTSNAASSAASLTSSSANAASQSSRSSVEAAGATTTGPSPASQPLDSFRSNLLNLLQRARNSRDIAQMPTPSDTAAASSAGASSASPSSSTAADPWCDPEPPTHQTASSSSSLPSSSTPTINLAERGPLDAGPAPRLTPQQRGALRALVDDLGRARAQRTRRFRYDADEDLGFEDVARQLVALHRDAEAPLGEELRARLWGVVERWRMGMPVSRQAVAWILSDVRV